MITTRVLRGHFVASSGRGYVDDEEPVNAPPHELPCGCTTHHRCEKAAALWRAMQQSSLRAWTFGDFASYVAARQEFIRHYTEQTDCPAALMQWWLARW